MDFFKITETMIEKANKYVPIIQKVEFVEYASERAFDRVEIGIGGEKRDPSIPPYFKDNVQRKNRYLLGAFLKLYLGVEYTPVEDDKWILSADDYDRYAGSHIFNQMERMKGSTKTRDFAYDILADYRMIEKMLNTEIYNMLQVMNDPVTRFVSVLSKKSSPETMKQQMEELKNLQKELEKFKAKKR